MSHQAVMPPGLDSQEPESPTLAFERVLNTDEAAGGVHPTALEIQRLHFERPGKSSAATGLGLASNG